MIVRNHIHMEAYSGQNIWTQSSQCLRWHLPNFKTRLLIKGNVYKKLEDVYCIMIRLELFPPIKNTTYIHMGSCTNLRRWTKF